MHPRFILALAGAASAPLAMTACSMRTTASPQPTAVESTGSTSGQTLAPATIASTRAVRRDIPITNMIRRAYTSGTRDSSGRPGKNYWQLWMDYTINASLDPPTSTLTGTETIVLHNNSPDTLTSIQMRLDQNIFRPSALRQSAPSENTDGFVITTLVVDGDSVDLAGGGRGGRAGGGGGGARGGGRGNPTTTTASGFGTTSGRINLRSPIPPHGIATLQVAWHHQIAGGTGGNGHRMNNRWGDTLFQVTQWYPRVAVFDDVRSGGWDTEPYLGPAEFYNNFGHFDVHIDVPGGWLVGATGVLQNPQDVLTPTVRERLSHVLESDSTRTIVGPAEGGPGRATVAAPRLTYHFVADTANDFAWGTAKQFVWQATRATIPGRGPIPVNLFYLPGHADNYAAGGMILRHALQFYSTLWMPEPFPVH
ncbi:MAG TPA: M1 family peptidase, partial [Gemmatimonadaceae bacterium]|nr:M1 family peptidase [Gemmatimonadaceae bacterium]